MKKLPTRFMGVLSRRQVERLVEALHGSRSSNPGVSYLADQGLGWRVARAWWGTYKSLSERGLVEYAPRSAYAAAYALTADGRATIGQILRSYPELEKKAS